MITVDAVTKAYGDTPVLGPVSEVLADRGITSVIGPNGAGKSTLLTIAGRLAEPDSGTVHVHVDDAAGAVGLDVHRARSADVAKLVAVLRQENHFTARLTVRELVSFGRFPHSRGRLTPTDVAAVDEALGFLDLTALQGRHLDELSGGQRQRAYVAMVLAQGTRHVLLDEPLNNLDIRHAVRMMRLLRRVADELGRAVALVVHDVNFAAAWSDRIVAVRDGRVVAQGTPEEVVREDVLREVFDTPVRVHVLDGVPTAVYFR
ncbi:ATP-binding cassette domain-containing protein [Paenibacillus sp. TRM 82003]|uniref:iron ABC transporter ATP-binding protein n=1 Tax=Kineococcus sp. TRM81007 TaxID=2925831 RepID=UPI001F5A1228|nr:ATP-binding cassette domain-containing protein [Kineococcus sp. TRM81007]MCI2239035.1 ATP-binding cassette domain-containing protein [Kineococcus sp. TRM81007]MCI3924455.1 ATP-binding cassette domain-containing protein [Paenibacillus sp. TRM 82003]